MQITFIYKGKKHPSKILVIDKEQRATKYNKSRFLKMIYIVQEVMYY